LDAWATVELQEFFLRWNGFIAKATLGFARLCRKARGKIRSAGKHPAI
jgi:hypothetical protein